MNKKIVLQSWPKFQSEEIQAVGKVLRSGKVNYWSGTEGRQFESEFAEKFGAKYAICVANGTVALELALQALGIGPGDEVIVTPRSFIASVSCVNQCGATPVFADVDPNSGNLSAETISRVITKKTKAVIPVHLGGFPCEMDAILKLGRKHKIHVIEDCAQSHGATYKGKWTGSMGRIGCFSFCQDKIMTTGGEGGMVITDNKKLWDAMWSFKDHGKSFNTVYKKKHPPGFRWLHESIGTNWRMTEMQSAIGRIWLRRLDDMVNRRREIASAYDRTLTKYPCLALPDIPSHSEHSYYRYYFYAKPESLKAGWSRDKIMAEFSKYGIPCFSGTCSEIYNEKAFDDMWPKGKALPTTQELGKISLTLPMHPALSKANVRSIASVADKVFSACSR